MSELLFERFWLMLLLAMVVSGGVIYWAMQRQTKNLVRAAKIVPVFFALLVGLNLWVITEREAIRERLDYLVRACEQGDADAVGAVLDEQFSAQGMSREELVAGAKDVFDRLQIPSVTLLGVEIKPAGETGNPVVKIATYAHVVSDAGHDYGSVRTDWQLTFIKRADGWYLYELRPLSIQMKPVQNINEVFDAARWVN